jgi:hypothetical protein
LPSFVYVNREKKAARLLILFPLLLRSLPRLSLPLLHVKLFQRGDDPGPEGRIRALERQSAMRLDPENNRLRLQHFFK